MLAFLFVCFFHFINLNPISVQKENEWKTDNSKSGARVLFKETQER